MRPWYERLPDRYEQERSFWRKNGFRERSQDGDRVFRGTLELDIAASAKEGFRHRSFELELRYRPAFPYEPPTVKFIRPEIRRQRHQSPGGDPCLFPPTAWHRHATPGEVLKALRAWIQASIAGSFPRELALYELPEYFDPSALTLLIPGDLVEAAGERTSGRFRAVEIKGRDLGLVTHLDGNAVGGDLLSALRFSDEVRQKTHEGSWYRLSREPQAPRRLGELVSLLGAEGHTLAWPRRPVETQLVGLIFEDAVLHQPRWIFVDIGLRKERKLPQLKAWTVRAPQMQVLAHEELFRRLEGVRRVDELATKRVALLGLGAVGSVAALALAREGIGAFTLCDPDRLRPGNMVRHVLDLIDVGQYKAEAVEAAIARINPFADTRAEVDHLRNPEVLARHLDEADLVISAIGSDTTEEFVNEIAVTGEVNPPILFVRTLHAGDVIRLILVRRGQDACFRCLMDYQEAGDPDWGEVAPSGLPDVFDAGCATPALPGSGLSSSKAGLLAARRGVDVLQGEARETNHWLSIERPIAGDDQRLQGAEQLIEAHLKPRHQCPICGAL